LLAKFQGNCWRKSGEIVCGAGSATCLYDFMRLFYISPSRKPAKLHNKFPEPVSQNFHSVAKFALLSKIFDVNFGEATWCFVAGLIVVPLVQ
jgi:hypothetical protein